MLLRWYQQEAVDSAYNFLCQEAGNPLICLPTGSGKSLVIAEIARRAVTDYGGRVLVLQHRKELITQNADKVRKLISIPVGEYSAGLRRFATAEDIVLCGIQSVYNKASLFDVRNLILIDEAHLCSANDESMYQTFFNDMRTVNPNIRLIGLTATPYRTGEGALCKADGVFQKLVYNAPIKQLMEEDFLCRVTNKPAIHEVNTSGLHMRYGEFIAKEVDNLFGGMATAEACKEILVACIGRHSIMVFCSSVKHAEGVVATFRTLTDDRVEMVEGNTSPLERAAILDGFVKQSIRILVNVDVLTTGFDAPCVDAIAILRATASPGLFAQIVGRGLRTHVSKTNCLVLDFGENIKRHGPIDAIDFGKPRAAKGETLEVDDDGKECPNCQLVVPSRKQLCECGFRFAVREPNHEQQADTQAQIISEPERFEVEAVVYSRHQKQDKTPSLRVDYRLASDGNLENIISEWICLEHVGFARRKAETWWKLRCELEVPASVDDALRVTKAVAVPKSIVAVREGKFWRVVEAEIEEVPDASLIAFEVFEEEEMPF
jgi:DNA repair protein RadD